MVTKISEKLDFERPFGIRGRAYWALILSSPLMIALYIISRSPSTNLHRHDKGQHLYHTTYLLLFHHEFSRLALSS